MGESESTTRGRSIGVSRSKSHAVTRGASVGAAQTTGTNQALSLSRGYSEALLPILEMRASSVHSKENVLYMAAQRLRALKTGMAFINYVDHTGANSALLQVPLRKTRPLSAERFAAVRDSIFAKSPSALPVEQARACLGDRRAALIAAARIRRLPPPEPLEAREFRVPAPELGSNSLQRRPK